MSQIPIHRQNTPPPGPLPDPPSTEDFIHYADPYGDLPTIESHVHPRFVICNSGLKLHKATLPAGEGLLPKSLRRVLAIWRSWTKPVPSGDFVDKVIEREDPNVEDNNSQRTAPHRVLRSSRNKGKAAGEQGSPTPKSKSSRQRALQDGGVWLDDETLHEFNSSDGGFTIPKNLWIMDWLKSSNIDSKCLADVQSKFKNCDCAMASGDGGRNDAAVVGGEA